MLRTYVIGASVFALSACGQNTETPLPENAAVTDVAIADAAAESPDRLAAVLDALPDEAKARFAYRNPKETLTFFGVEPGMTVVDTTPGSIWYSGILAAYLGPDGTVIGADRPLSVWEWFGPDYSPPEFLAERPNWVENWPEERALEAGEEAASFDAFAYGNVPEAFTGTADVVLMMREFHNIMASDESGELATNVLAEIHGVLKTDGVFGMVQHRANEEMDDAWANGVNGYLKQTDVIAIVESAGFVLEATSEVNANPKDQPTEDEFVWRLPPDLSVPEGDSARREDMIAIGESDRMTLRFRKVSAG